MATSDWKKCEGVNARTGRIKKGWKIKKGGGCPDRAAKTFGKKIIGRKACATIAKASYARGVSAGKKEWQKMAPLTAEAKAERERVMWQGMDGASLGRARRRRRRRR